MEPLEITTKLIKLNETTFRLVVWKEGQVTDIMEGSVRVILNDFLKLAHNEGFTEDKFKVRL